MSKFHVLQESNVGKINLFLFDKWWYLPDHFGVLQPQDVGKRIYKTGERVLQIENDEQFKIRTGMKTP
mgnify:CR=1 FL=1